MRISTVFCMIDDLMLYTNREILVFPYLAHSFWTSSMLVYIYKIPLSRSVKQTKDADCLAAYVNAFLMSSHVIGTFCVTSQLSPRHICRCTICQHNTLVWVAFHLRNNIYNFLCCYEYVMECVYCSLCSFFLRIKTITFLGWT